MYTSKRQQDVAAGQRRRDRIRRAHQAVDGPGLAADLGRRPAGEHGNEAKRRRRTRRREGTRACRRAARAPAAPSSRDQRQHEEADADHDAEGEERDRHRRPLVGRALLQPAHRAIPAVGQDQAAQTRHLDDGAVGLVRLVGQGEQDQRQAGRGLPVRLDRGELGRLVFERVEPVQVAEEQLQRHEEGQQPERHREHDPALVHEAPAPDDVGGHAQHHEAGGHVEGDDRVRQAIGEGGLENDRQPVFREEPAVDHLVTRPASASSCWWPESRTTRTSVPNATISAATKCAQRGTSLRPNRSTPRKADSRKNAVSPS